MRQSSSSRRYNLPIGEASGSQGSRVKIRRWPCRGTRRYSSGCPDSFVVVRALHPCSLNRPSSSSHGPSRRATTQFGRVEEQGGQRPSNASGRPEQTSPLTTRRREIRNYAIIWSMFRYFAIIFGVFVRSSAIIKHVAYAIMPFCYFIKRKKRNND